MIMSLNKIKDPCPAEVDRILVKIKKIKSHQFSLPSSQRMRDVDKEIDIYKYIGMQEHIFTE